jgi:hypothetical protein
VAKEDRGGCCEGEAWALGLRILCVLLAPTVTNVQHTGMWDCGHTAPASVIQNEVLWREEGDWKFHAIQ